MKGGENMRIAILVIAYVIIWQSYQCWKAAKAKKAERIAKRAAYVEELEQTIKEFQKHQNALANRKSAQDPYWF